MELWRLADGGDESKRHTRVLKSGGLRETNLKPGGINSRPAANPTPLGGMHIPDGCHIDLMHALLAFSSSNT
jgi:hypothetical protein